MSKKLQAARERREQAIKALMRRVIKCGEGAGKQNEIDPDEVKVRYR
jgi:hypothetical protein